MELCCINHITYCSPLPEQGLLILDSGFLQLKDWSPVFPLKRCVPGNQEDREFQENDPRGEKESQEWKIQLQCWRHLTIWYKMQPLERKMKNTFKHDTRNTLLQGAYKRANTTHRERPQHWVVLPWTKYCKCCNCQEQPGSQLWWY